MKKRIWMVILALVIALMMAGCSSGSGDSAGAESSGGFTSDYMENATESWEESGNESVAPAEGALPGERVETNRKLVRTADMTLETQDFESTLEGVRSLVAQMGGYLERSEVYSEMEFSRTAELTARVPADSYAQTSEALAALGHVTRSMETADDVTDEYYDLQAELDALHVQQDRLLALMEQAASVEDLMALEEELTQVRYRINERTSALKHYDGLVDYATFHLSIQEVVEITESDPVETFGQRVQATFFRSLDRAAELGRNLILAVVSVLPFLLIYGGIGVLLALVVLLVVRLAQRGRRGRKKAG